MDRFWSKVIKTETCWIWTSTITHGYGYFAYRGKNVRAHRLAYTLLKGEIPVGLHLDHLCRNRSCVNPKHLEPVTNKENIKRSPIHMGVLNLLKTHCPYGHEYSGNNLGENKRGSGKTSTRRCQACHRESERLRRAKRL